jgi:hypothetical protein
MRLDHDGNLGIGTSGGLYRLHAHISYSNNNKAALFSNESFGFPSHCAYDTVQILQDDVPTLRITEYASGIHQDLGIGVGDGYTNFTTNVPYRFWAGCTVNSTNYNGSGGTLAMYITTGANVGINTNNPSYRLHVVGDIYASGNITAYSDVRQKKNIMLIENAIDKVNKIRGVTFDRADETEEEYKRYTGVIAQEVMQVLPEAVAGNEEIGYSVAYGNMVGLLIEAVKELTGRVESLQSELNTLKSKG